MKKNIVNNLANAINQQKNEDAQEEFDEVKGFLGTIKLEKYFDKFIENGLEDEETILELKDNHIEEMGIPLGHKLKIMKKIKDLREAKGMSSSVSR